MAGKVRTYNPKENTIAAGSHIVTGYADDSFISIEPSGDGVSKKTGCDGEIVRAISPDKSYKVKLTLLQTSDSNAFFSRMYDLDQETGEGTFPLLIKDLKGGLVFSAETAWVTKKASVTRGKESNNREWELDTGEAELTE